MKVKYWLLIIVVLLGVVFFAPSVLCMNSLCKFFSFNQDTGAVGDTIGGTTAPIVGLISIFLLIWTLIEQKKSNDKQIRFMQDERFENTLFNLLNEQREITSSLYIDFHGLAKNDVTKEIHTNVRGYEFFKMAVYELKILFKSLDSKEFHKEYDSEAVGDMMEQIADNLYYGENLPYELKLENEESILEGKNTALAAYFNDLYKISQTEFLQYKSKSVENKIQFVYKKYFSRRINSGHYFRHLYRILKFIELNETRELNMLRNDEQQSVKNKYLEYAQFVQAQMSIEELLVIFYNSFCFPKMKAMLIKYNLLENLNVEKLIKSEHNCEPQYHLKRLDEI